MKLTRREFAYSMLGVAASPAFARVQRPSLPLVDFHTHLFGVGDGGTGCFVSASQRKNVTYPFFLRLLGLSENGRLDQNYLDRIVQQLKASSVKKAVLLAQDCRYDKSGKPDMENTSFFVPNDYLLRVTTRFPELFIPCISINPSRQDAIAELEKRVEQGAKVLKIHPPIQCVDPSESRFRPFYRKCSERGVIVMVHTGTEHSAKICNTDYSAPRRLVTALEEGCTVVAAHSGMNAFFDKEDFFPQLIEMIRRFPNLYCDTAVLGDKFRWRSLPRMLDRAEVLERTIYASDAPFPSNPLVFWNRLRPAKLLSLLSETNLFERNYRLLEALGLPAEVFGRGARILGLI